MNSNPLQPNLAVDGEEPTFASDHFCRSLDTAAVRESVLNAVDDDAWQGYHGRCTSELILKLAERFQQEHVMLCCSGTIAVELALRGEGVRAGDEVLISGYDFPGNFRAIEAIGAIPVLLDVVNGGYTIDASLIAPAISDKTKAIIVSHLHGQIADLVEIRNQIEHHSPGNAPISILEDACQVPGGTLNERPLGSFGETTSLSFGGSKLLTAGRGGAVLCNDPAKLQRIKVFADRGNDSFPMSQLQAAALLPQLDTLDDQTTSRTQAAERLNRLLNDIESIGTLSQVVSGVPAFYKLPIRLIGPEFERQREAFVSMAMAEGIPIGIGFRGFINRSQRRCRKPVQLDNCRSAISETMLIHHSVLDADEATLEQVTHLFATIAKRLS